jgi:hypothetical protein
LTKTNKQNASNGADLSANEFLTLLRSSRPGESITYFTGELGYAIDIGDKNAKALQSVVFDAYERGECILTQKRLSERNFEYRATKRHPRATQATGRTEAKAKVKSSALSAQFI